MASRRFSWVSVFVSMCAQVVSSRPNLPLKIQTWVRFGARNYDRELLIPLLRLLFPVFPFPCPVVRYRACLPTMDRLFPPLCESPPGSAALRMGRRLSLACSAFQIEIMLLRLSRFLGASPSPLSTNYFTHDGRNFLQGVVLEREALLGSGGLGRKRMVLRAGSKVWEGFAAGAWGLGCSCLSGPSYA